MKKIYYLLEIQVFGKTYLSNCIAKEILDNNKTVLYQTAPNMLDNIISYRFGNDIKFTELFNIINTRSLNENNKITKTIISTNLNLHDILNNYDERIFSRIVGEYNICKFFGEDLRFKK